MKKYRTKSVIVEAWQWAVDCEDLENVERRPSQQDPTGELGWHTAPSGRVHVIYPGTYIVKGADGLLGTVAPEVFEEWYEPVDEDT